MAFASIIASAIGILLLIITAYVLVGGVLTTTQIAMNAQSDMTAVHMQMLGTAITPESTSVGNCTADTPPHKIIMIMKNSGTEPIDISHIDVFIVKTTGTVPVRILKGLPCEPWKWSVYPDTKVQWRPTEDLTINVTYPDTDPRPVKIQITTGNGVSAITEVPPP